MKNKCKLCNLNTAGEHESNCPSLHPGASDPPLTGLVLSTIESHWHPSDRQYFAAAAMQGIISNADTMREITKAAGKDSDGAEFFRAVGNIAYKYADAMLKAQS